MIKLSVNGRPLEAGPNQQAILQRAYEAKQNPLCMCRREGVPMYIAHYAGSYIVKRMPGKGNDHDPDCDSYELPLEVSGLADVEGRAIQEDTDAGTTELRVNFPLTKSKGKAPPASDGSNRPGSVKSDGGRLTMLSLLHYFWDQAGFNRWHPGMEGKRTWAVVRKYLLQAANNKIAKGVSLSRALYIPETWNLDDSTNIYQRMLTQLRMISKSGEGGKAQLAIVIGELKSIGPHGNAVRMVLKHAPDAAFVVPADLQKRAQGRFDSVLRLRGGAKPVHIIVLATLSIDPAGNTTVEELTMMATNEEWIPIEGAFDEQLVARVIEEKRRFIKGLRYNLSASAPMASLVITDTVPATACYVLDSSISDEFSAALAELQVNSPYKKWVWNLDEGAMPALPPATKPAEAPPGGAPPNRTMGKPASAG